MKPLFQTLLFAILAVQASGASTLTVISTSDSGVGSLRAAIAEAEPGDTINLSATGTIFLNHGELRVTNSVTIVGPGANSLTVDANYASRVFFIGSNSVVTISGLSIANGYATGNYFNIYSNSPVPRPYGGGIYNYYGSLTVSNCIIRGNLSPFAGGGIYNAGDLGGTGRLLVVNSTVSGNSAITYGGGIGNGAYFGTAILELINCTVNANNANYGGGIYNDGYSGSANLRILNSTLTRNSASQGGGIKNVGVLGNGNAEILSSTLSENLAAQGGGSIYNDGASGSATAQFANTILKAGEPGGNIQNNGSVVITSLGNNLSSDDAGDLLTDATDRLSTDPKLGQLQNNGGPTFTQALLEGSPAIDNGDDMQTGTDQRGFARKAGQHVDIGAFERQPVSLPLRINSIWRTAGGVVHLSFTNSPGAIFSVLSTSDPSLPQTNWMDLGLALQPAPGQFQFSDQQPSLPLCLYRVRSD